MHARRHAHERGSNVVEAAVVIPLLIFLLASVVDLGGAYITYTTLIDAAREGGRYGASHPTETTKICDKALAEAQGQKLLVPLIDCAVSTPQGAVPGQPVRVTVRADFPALLGGILGRSTIPMSYSVAFRIRCEAGGTC
jgi:Flp pilus assembly protein TadG